MVWEDIEDDESELLEETSYNARKRHYKALSQGLTFYILILTLFLASFFVVLWFTLRWVAT